MNDILPQEAQQRAEVASILSRTYARWGFIPIECPAMETIDRLLSSEGGDNEKLIFQVLRRGLQQEDYAEAIADPSRLVDLGLRFDLTVPLARFYASNYMSIPKVSKLLQQGPVWRAERPQRGRYRQFMQWDADILGSEEGLAEIELISSTAEAILALGLDNFVVRFNDRRLLKALISSVGIETEASNEALILIDKLDKIGVAGIRKELSQRGFNSRSIQLLVQKIEPFIDSKAASIGAGLEQLQLDIESTIVTSMEQIFSEVLFHAKNYSIVFDPTLVRGMGYYTGPIFEIQVPGYSASIAGGGRYDGMIGRFLGKEVPACGLSLGFDRLVALLGDKVITDSTHRKLLLLFAPEDARTALTQAAELRKQGWDVNAIHREKNTKKQIADYQVVGFTHFAILNPSGETTTHAIE